MYKSGIQFMFFLPKKLQKSRSVLPRKEQLKFERNARFRYRDNCDMDGQWMNFDFKSSADIVNQS